MSRFFNGTTNGHLDVASATVSAYPMSMCAWVKLGALGAVGQVMNCGTSASSDNRFSLTVDAAGFVSVAARDTTQQLSTSFWPITDLTSWWLISATFTNATSRDAYLNGGSVGSNVTSKTPGVSNAMAIGATTLPSAGFNGFIAHVALWNLALSAADHAALMLGLPSSVQAANLQEYWPLTNGASPEPSLGLNPNSMIVTATAVTGIYSSDNPQPGYTPPLRSQCWS